MFEAEDAASGASISAVTENLGNYDANVAGKCRNFTEGYCDVPAYTYAFRRGSKLFPEI